jgi:hypothetical protein
VATLIPQTSLVPQLLPRQPPQAPPPLVPEAPQQETARQAVPQRLLLLPWLLCETSALAHSLLVPVSSSAPFSKQAMARTFEIRQEHCFFSKMLTFSWRLFDDLCILYLWFGAFSFSIGVAAAAWRFHSISSETSKILHAKGLWLWASGIRILIADETMIDDWRMKGETEKASNWDAYE